MNATGSFGKKDQKLGFEYVEDEKVIEIYKNIGKNIEKNKSQEKKNIDYDDVPLNVKKELNIQESALNSKEKSLEYNYNISKYLAKKSKKKEEDLLINQTDQLRIKKEFEELFLNKNINSYENKVPTENWMMNLRKNKINNNPDTSYIYYGDIHNPFWIPVREKKNKSIEIIRNPLSKSRTNFNSYENVFYNSLGKNSSFNTTNLSNNSYNSFNSFNFMHNNGEPKNISCSNSMNTFNKTLLEKEMIV